MDNTKKRTKKKKRKRIRKTRSNGHRSKKDYQQRGNSLNTVNSLCSSGELATTVFNKFLQFM